MNALEIARRSRDLALAFFLVAATLAAPGIGAPRRKNTTPPDPARERLVQHCQAHASDPDNPWALAHGLLALGPDFEATDGRPAREVVLSHLPPGEGPARFPRFSASGHPVDPHPGLILRALLLSGGALDEELPSPRGPLPLSALVEAVMEDFTYPPADPELFWREGAWTLELLSRLHAPGPQATLERAGGERVEVGAVLDDALFQLERASAALSRGMARGALEVPKDRRGIYAHPCGGLHLAQAVFGWARHPEVKRAWGKRLTHQVEVLFYRLASERRQYEAALRAHPRHRLEVLSQQLKFYGHFLETAAVLRDGGHRFTPSQKRDLALARRLLTRTVRDLDRLGALERAALLQQTHRQLYLDLLGDACHAARGLSGWR